MRSSRSGAERTAFLLRKPFAHRGLHGGEVIENSRCAFDAAIKLGHGIELDVQISYDGEAIVFHDYDLDRLTAAQGPLAARTTEALRRVTLSGSGEPLAPLPEVLAHVAGRVPVLIEVKLRRGPVAPLCRAVLRALSRYRGQAAVMAFNPRVPRWFARHAPRVTRGLVVTEQATSGSWLARRASLWLARPDFLAYDIASLPSATSRRWRAAGRPLLSWTVRTDDQRANAAIVADQIIYERTP